MSEIKEYKCTRCGRLLPLSAFYRDIYRSDNRSPWCKECKRSQAFASNGFERVRKICSRFTDEELEQELARRKQANEEEGDDEHLQDVQDEICNLLSPRELCNATLSRLEEFAQFACCGKSLALIDFMLYHLGNLWEEVDEAAITHGTEEPPFRGEVSYRHDA